MTNDQRYVDMGRTFLDALGTRCRTESGGYTVRAVES